MRPVYINFFFGLFTLYDKVNWQAKCTSQSSDGNGRWATQRGLPRTAGHVEGAKAACAVVEAAVRAGVNTLTLCAFTAANWARPLAEVDALMRLFRRYLMSSKCTMILIDEHSA
jgi:undecaprenyl diphosphate synthase